ncbi:hypothetical protein CR513_31015, partial [Mucuna pruriens]
MVHSFVAIGEDLNSVGDDGSLISLSWLHQGHPTRLRGSNGSEFLECSEVAFFAKVSNFAHFDLELQQMNVKITFLNNDLCGDVYMDQPNGFKEKGKEHLVCKLRKSIYGLKQVSRQWYLKFDKMGANSSFLYYMWIISLYLVNDMNILLQTKQMSMALFDMKNLGNASFVLGIKIHHDRSRGILDEGKDSTQYGELNCTYVPILSSEELY